MEIVEMAKGVDTIIRGNSADGRSCVYLIWDGQKYYLPAQLGGGFGWTIFNLTDAVRAYPIVIVSKDGREKNIFLADGLTDPNLFLADGGMVEVGEAGSEYNSGVSEGFKLPEKREQLFVFVEDGAGLEGFDANLFRIYVRTPVDPTMTIAKYLSQKAPRMSRGSVGAGETVIENREQTGIAYNADAQLVATIEVISFEEAKRMLREANVDVPHTWYYPMPW
jgi:hypothetical protein